MNIKEKILATLEGKNILKCPYCNHTVFIRKAYARVELIDDGETIKDEVIELGFENCGYICANCGEDVTEEELIK